MARPKKQTIDYFPHFVNGGKTKLILQNEFGNDGYAFWFKLLEVLCKSENQVYDYNNPAAWRFLLAETHVNEETARNILKLLAELEAIDGKLNEAKIIWSQHLIENLEEVYRRRATGKPEKPVIVDKNPVIAINNPIPVGVSASNNLPPPLPPLRVNKSRVNKSKQEETKLPFGQFSNVLLTAQEHEKLGERFGPEGTKERIEALSEWLASKGKHRVNHYATILTWERMHEKGENNGQHGQVTTRAPGLLRKAPRPRDIPTDDEYRAEMLTLQQPPKDRP